MREILVVGTAECVYEDLDALGDRNFEEVIAVNEAVQLLEFPPDFVATVHPERARDFSRMFSQVVSLHHATGVDIVFDSLPWRYGTSALYAVAFALQMRSADRVVVAGCPLVPGTHCNSSRPLGGDIAAYRRAWCDVKDTLQKSVVSLSGWTRELIGTTL